jgi:hypothetical protein
MNRCAAQGPGARLCSSIIAANVRAMHDVGQRRARFAR